MLALLVLAGAGGYYYFTHRHAATLNFTTATVTRGELIQTVTATDRKSVV